MTQRDTVEKLPEWPDVRDYAFGYINGKHDFRAPTVELAYLCARAAYWEARCRVAVEALNCLYPALAFDLRYAEDRHEPEARSAYESRLDTVVGAIQAIGVLPKEPTP